MHSVQELAEFLVRNPGIQVESEARFRKVVKNRVVETAVLGPVVRRITQADANSFTWEGPLIGNDPSQTGTSYMAYNAAMNGTPWVWTVAPGFFTITVDMGDTADRTGRWYCQIECRFLPQTAPVASAV